MKKTTLNPIQTAELIALRSEQDLGVVPLARRFNVRTDQVRRVLKTHGLSTQTVNQRIAWCVNAHPDWTDGEVATHCECEPATVADRRHAISENRRHREKCEGVEISEKADRGKEYRVSRTWLRSQCSRGERDCRQIQAMCVIAGLHFTLAEIKASCIAAGLIVPTSGPVYAALGNKNGGE